MLGTPPPTPSTPIPPTHARQCSRRTPTSSPTRLSSAGCILCRHTARSSWLWVWKTTSCAWQLVTLNPVTCGDVWVSRLRGGGGGLGATAWAAWHGQGTVASVVRTAWWGQHGMASVVGTAWWGQHHTSVPGEFTVLMRMGPWGPRRGLQPPGGSRTARTPGSPSPWLTRTGCRGHRWVWGHSRC